MPRERRNIASGAPWEESVGYSRASRIGALVSISGTCARPPYARLGSPQEAYRQAKQALEIIQQALNEAGARMEDVIRTRMFVTHIERDSEAVGRAHKEFFGEIRPATSMIGVARLIDKKLLVEIEADAVISGD